MNMNHNLIIRIAEPDDAAAMLDIYAYYVENTAVTFAYTAPTVKEFEEKITHILHCHPFIAAQQDGVVVGYAYASPFYGREAYNWDCEMSIYVHRDAHGCGVGRALYEEMERLLLSQGVFNLYACIAEMRETQDAHLTHDSQAFHSRMGYKTVARFDDCGFKFGRWYDVIWMQKRLLSTIPVPPPVFRTFEQVRGQLT